MKEDICFCLSGTSLGHCLMAISVRGVCAIFMGDEPQSLIDALHDRFPGAVPGHDLDLAHIKTCVTRLIDHPGTPVDFPLDIRGTAFQQKVWRALQGIAPGKTASYAEIARLVGAPRASRAVANACAANPIAVAIPCHRVIHGDGSLSGYRWGMARKRALLDEEAQSSLAFRFSR